MRRLLVFALLLVLSGCPGQRRPAPVESVPAPPPTVVDDDSIPPPLEVSVAGLTAGLADLKRERDAFTANPAGPGEHARLMQRVNAVQTLAFQLQDSEDEAVLDAVYPLLEELEDIRSDVVQLEPK